MTSRSFTDLRVWQKSHLNTLAIYRLSRTFPPEERYGLAGQLRRAAVSVGTNIAEGFGRRHSRDKARFYNIAEGSTEELKNLLLVARDLGYSRDCAALLSDMDDVSRMLRSLVDKTLAHP